MENPISSRLFDKANDRLIYIGKSATPDLWDTLWSMDREAVQRSLSPTRDCDQLVAVTRHHLDPSEGAILEGGCGRGQYVAALTRAGFKTIGIDYAQETVKALNEHAPDLDIRFGDVRSLPLQESSVAGYWSIGVIEHFWDGFETLAAEMSRVIKDGGCLFCSFPFLNPMRQLKARMGLYPLAEFESEPSDFYQFALSKPVVVETMSRHGFTLVGETRLAGFKGILGELGPLSSALEPLYEYEGNSLFVRGVRKAVDLLFTKIGCSHSIQLVFRRRAR
ncbi:MAG: class I SAM-dependent methyltransferase [Gammaproteobacteria bacterium]|nr:class I SAM-dependent methyltransferase [Gammaproteobacteria bacterium]